MIAPTTLSEELLTGALSGPSAQTFRCQRSDGENVVMTAAKSDLFGAPFTDIDAAELSRIVNQGEVVRKDGIFLTDDLKPLNPENLV